jgi:hypothetical protein
MKIRRAINLLLITVGFNLWQSGDELEIRRAIDLLLIAVGFNQRTIIEQVLALAQTKAFPIAKNKKRAEHSRTVLSSFIKT